MYHVLDQMMGLEQRTKKLACPLLSFRSFNRSNFMFPKINVKYFHNEVTITNQNELKKIHWLFFYVFLLSRGEGCGFGLFSL